MRSVRARLGEQGLAELVEAYEAGSPTTALMERFGLSKGATLQLLRQAGVDIRKQPLGADAVIEARAMYDNGASLAKAAEKVGSAATTVRRALIDAGVTMRPRGGSTKRPNSIDSDSGLVE